MAKMAAELIPTRRFAKEIIVTTSLLAVLSTDSADRWRLSYATGRSIHLTSVA
jgi:hypothetical protein